MFYSPGAGGYCDVLLIGERPRFEEFTRMLNQEPDKHRLKHAISETIARYEQRSFSLRLGTKELVLGPCPRIMGILNVTPDSFYDGGRFRQLDKALAQGLRMVEEGADIIDVGGQSSRPGSEQLPLEEELARAIPVVKELARRTEVPISIDTYHSEVAQAALDAGALAINDITACRGDRKMAKLAASTGIPVVLMHMQGQPETMQKHPRYRDLMSEICLYLRQSIELACQAGVSEQQIIVDPGIGFGKTVAHNLEIIARLKELASLGRPVLIGPSRKSFIGAVLDLPAEERLLGTAASLVLARVGGAHVFRVHDVQAAKEVLTLSDAILEGGAAQH